MFRRALSLPNPPTETFFLWGPRQTGKSTLLRTAYPDAPRIDLLKSDEHMRYLTRPALLREEALATPPGRFVLIDEIQKVPALLDEVHWLIENRGDVFGLSGSSARRVRGGRANLLGGRAVRYELTGLVSHEIGKGFDLERLLNHGTLPRHYASENPARLLRSYVHDYLREEIAHEGLVRNLPAFADFLSVAALSDAEILSYATIARECGISAPTVREYFQILSDTLLGRVVPAYTKRPKRRVIQAPKFFFADVGVVNLLTRRGRVLPGGELFGKAFENWVHHELLSASRYLESFEDIRYWRLTTGMEVDFILDDMWVAIEAKAKERITSDDLRGLRELAADYPRLKSRLVVSLEKKTRRTEDGIEILPYRAFAERLWAGALAGSG